MPGNPPAILRLPDVRRATGLSRPTIYRMMDRGDFPRQLKLSANCVGWNASEISSWVASRPQFHT